MRHSILVLFVLFLTAPFGRTQNLHVNDGSGDRPKLWIAINVWGLEGLPAGGPEWSLEEKLQRLKKAGGFDAVDRYTAADPKSE